LPGWLEKESLENLDELREPIKKFCEIKFPYDWDEISNEEAEFLDAITDEIASLEPRISKVEALAMLNNIGPTDLDGVGLSITNCVYESRDWPIEEVLYINKPSDPLSEFKLECLGSGLRYRFTSEKNTSIIVDFENYMEKYMELVPPLTLVDFRFIIASLGSTWKPDLPDNFYTHMRYLYNNTPETKQLKKSDLSDREKDWLHICFNDDRFYKV
jgi:hypothetical protein